MDREGLMNKICALYKKERDYQVCAHGDYTNVETLNLGSFLVLIEHYLNKAKASYSGPWKSEKPPWLNGCKEDSIEGFSPIDAYEELIKIFTLAGAALEVYTDINIARWREDIEQDLKKWEKEQKTK